MPYIPNIHVPSIPNKNRYTRDAILYEKRSVGMKASAINYLHHVGAYWDKCVNKETAALKVKE